MLHFVPYCRLRARERKCNVSQQQNTVNKLSCHFCGFYTGGRNFFDFIPAMCRPPFQIDFTTVPSASQCCKDSRIFIFFFCEVAGGVDTSIVNGSQDLYHYPAGPNESVVA